MKIDLFKTKDGIGTGVEGLAHRLYMSIISSASASAAAIFSAEEGGGRELKRNDISFALALEDGCCGGRTEMELCKSK